MCPSAPICGFPAGPARAHLAGLFSRKVHPDLERIVVEDEMARAAVDAAAAAGGRRVDAAHADIAQARDQRLRELAQQVDDAVAAIRSASERDSALRREHREAFGRERAAASATAVDEAVALFVAIVREGAPPRGTG